MSEHTATNEPMAYCEACNQQTVESVSSRRYSHEDMHDAEQRAFMAGQAEGERAATERIVKWLRSDRWIGFRSTCMSLAYAIERGEHE
jgi:ribosomal protein L44E